MAHDFWRSKTTWTGIGAVVTAVGMAATGVINWQEAAGAIFLALQSMFLRDAIAKR